jgi:hypothetical protein
MTGLDHREQREAALAGAAIRAAARAILKDPEDGALRLRCNAAVDAAPTDVIREAFRQAADSSGSVYERRMIEELARARLRLDG